jgi:hypothetical protein
MRGVARHWARTARRPKASLSVPATIRSATSSWNISVSDSQAGGQSWPESQPVNSMVPTL